MVFTLHPGMLVPVSTVRRVLGLRMDNTASGYGEQLETLVY